MADILPPAPVNSPMTSFAWTDWFVKLVFFVNSQTNILWSSINKAGANLTDLPTRLHNDLQTVQGGAAGDRQHLTTAQVGSLSNIGILLTTTSTIDPVLADISAGTAKLWKNTTSGQVRLWTNDGGTLKSVQLI
jgi:hypothetical protein